LKKSKIIKNQQVSQVIRVNPKTFQLKNRSQENISSETKSKQSLEFVYSYFLKWINAWEQKDVNSYMSFYSKKFVGTQKSRVGWEAHRHRALKTNSNIAIQIRNIQLHQSDKIIELNFTQHFKSDRYSDIGIKELIWAKNEGTWRIIKETWMLNEETLRVKETNNSKNFISSQLLNWVDAWGNQNINLYISFYSKNFMGTKRSRSEWEAYRHRALKANSNITIQVSNIHLHQNEETVEVSFKQRFKSDHYSDVGIKELVWRKTGRGWKILKETWIPS
jgi:murein L,D-transpeptidase YafK